MGEVGHCTGGCEVCCAESLAEVEARLNAALEQRQVLLSGAVAIALVVGHIVFEWHGKHLPVPEYLYAIAAGPLIGKFLKLKKAPKEKNNGVDNS